MFGRALLVIIVAVVAWAVVVRGSDASSRGKDSRNAVSSMFP